MSRLDRDKLVKPALLMLSHCVPDAQGKPDQVRAWDQLKTACRTHQVHLVCAQDAPIHLVHWRALTAQAQRVVIEPISRRRALTGFLCHPFSRAAADAHRLTHMLRHAVADAGQAAHFDVVLATTPALDALAQSVPARLCLCAQPAARDKQLGTILLPPAVLPLRRTPKIAA